VLFKITAATKQTKNITDGIYLLKWRME